MSEHWISNTIFLHGFSDIRELFEFLETIRNYPRHESGIVMPGNCTIDLEYFTINISYIQNQVRLSISFLTDSNIARRHVAGILPVGKEHIKLTYAVIDTRTEAVELYNFAGNELTSHKSVPRGLGRPLLEELERLPETGRNLTLSIQELDVLEFPEFQQITQKIFPV